MVSTRHHGEGPVQAGASPDTHADHAKQQSSAAAAAAQEHGQAADKGHASSKQQHTSYSADQPDTAVNGIGDQQLQQEQEQEQQHATKQQEQSNGQQQQQHMDKATGDVPKHRPRRSTAGGAAAAAGRPAVTMLPDDDSDPANESDGDDGDCSSSDDDRHTAAGRRTRGTAAADAAAEAPSPVEHDRAARTGRALRAQVKKPTELTTFTKEPPRSQVSRKERERQQRLHERQQRQQQQELKQQRRRQLQQQKEREIALRAAAAGRLTRHVVKVLPGVIEASTLPAAELAAVATVAAVAAANGESAAADADGPVCAEDGVTIAAAAGPATAAKPKRGLKGEVLLLQQQMQQLQQLQQRKQQREAERGSSRHIPQQPRGQQWHSLRERQQQLDYKEQSGEEDDDDDQDLDDDQILDHDGSDNDGNLDQGLGRSGRYSLRHKRSRSERDNGDDDNDDDDAVENGGSGSDDEDDDNDDDEDDEDDDDRPVRRKYQLRSRHNYGAIERFSPRHGNATSTAAAAAATGVRRPSTTGRGSGDRRRDRTYSRGAGSRGHKRSRGGFSEGGSSDDDDLLRKLRSDSHWNAFLANHSGPPGPYYIPAAQHLNTPAAAVAAAAAAAANGLLSPANRHGAAAVAGDGQQGLAAAGSGWGHWGVTNQNNTHASNQALSGPEGLGGSGFRDAAATAGGREGRGGLGQELITPLQVDPSIGFDQVGGLDHYLSALKEMIFLPLLYPELFEKFGVNSPRGVLFHGPPGTGKTLVARALAAQASKAAGQKVSFYMRKGADLLSKWVGEAEKQLRLLFEEAQRNQPAIIFFDEIDGLAPVRTSKQDQVHNSIVSTLLALMDGLESRGRVVLIGATNRPDALDPALRRPGRFDRELLFPLPDLKARRAILAIHSRSWQPQPDPALLDELAGLTAGYCGADIKALCAEASLAALRRVYPQIYESDVKLLINPAAVVVSRQDLLTAMQGLTPAAHRASASHARPLSPVVRPCLTKPLQAALQQLKSLFPPAAACLAATAAAAAGQRTKLSASSSSSSSSMLNGSSSSKLFCMARPRLLLAGVAGAGQQQMAAAVLAALEGLPVYAIGLANLLATAGSRCVEEALVSAFTEARRAAPAIIYWPQAHLWWAAAGSGLRCALIALLDDLPQDVPLLLLATAELQSCPSAAVGSNSSSGSGRNLVPFQQKQQMLEHLGLEPSLAALFPAVGTLNELGGLQHFQQQQQQQQQFSVEGELTAAAAAGSSTLGWVLLGQISSSERQEMFKQVLQAAAAPPAPAAAAAAVPPPPPLPPAPDAQAAAAAAKEAAAAAAARAAYEDDQAVLRSLRIVLRTIVTRALGQKRYRLFAEPPLPDEEGGVEALQALTQPMDLLTMLYKVDHQQYGTPAAFLADAHLIVKCAEELYGDPEAAAADPPEDPAAAAAAAAAAAGSSAFAAAAAAGDGSSMPVLTRSLPAVRIAVSKEISRAMELKDDLEAQVYQLLSPDLVRACEAISAKGGPAPPPPGMLLPQSLLPAAAAAAAAGRGGVGGSSDKAKSTRATARLSGRHLDKKLMHADPEALMRALKQPRKPPLPAAAAARVTLSGADTHMVPEESQQQQQQHQRQASVAAEDSEMADSEQQPAAAAAAAAGEGQGADGAAAAVFGPAATGMSNKQQHQLQESPADVVQPVTHGVNRKRPAAASADVERPAKLHAVAAAAGDGATQQQQQQQAGLGSLRMPEHDAAAAAAAADMITPRADMTGSAMAPDTETAAEAAVADTADVAVADALLQQLVAATAGMQLSELELLHARLSRVVAANDTEVDRQLVLQRVANVVCAVEQQAAAGAAVAVGAE